MKWAHAAGLTVTPWTFRSSNTGHFARVREEMAKFLYEYGVDALFTDNPDQFPQELTLELGLPASRFQLDIRRPARAG